GRRPGVSRSLSAVGADEVEHPPPGIGRLLGELRLLAVEEGMRRPGISDYLVVDTGGGERRLQRGDRFGRDRRVVASHQTEDRCFDQIATFQEGAVAGGPVDVGSSVEADGTGQSVAVGGGRPRAGATETKANGEYPHVGVPS